MKINKSAHTRTHTERIWNDKATLEILNFLVFFADFVNLDIEFIFCQQDRTVQSSSIQPFYVI